MRPEIDAQTPRSNLRFSPGELRPGTIRIGDTQSPVQILDESVAGFGILVDGSFDWELGQQFMLRTDAGWCEVRVMNARPVDLSAEVEFDDADPFATLHITRLGVLRLSDTSAEPAAQSVSLPFRFALRSVRAALAPLYSTLGGAVATAACVLAGGGVLIWALESPRHALEASARELPEPRHRAEPRPARSAPQAQRATAPAERANATPTEPPRVPPTESPTESLDAAEQVLELLDPLEAGLQLPRPDVLVRPEVVRKLSLSPQQQQQLRALYEPPAQSAAATPEQAPESSALSDEERIRNRRALNILTPAQQDAWRRLAAEVDLQPEHPAQP
ncbi:MAG: hypothetical protein AB7O59_19125 [Pirellulales bacterium]